MDTQSELSYEFTAEHNTVFSWLAKGMRIVGLFSMLVGGLSLMSLVAGDVAASVGGISWLLIGFWTLNAAKSFRVIVETDGADLNHLMKGIGDLKSLCTLQSIRPVQHTFHS